LLGQPELNRLLERNDLRQLAQRITARYHLNPLNTVESGEYIRHRLAVAGCNRPVFSPQAIKLVHRFSHGTPRLINLLCDRAMLGVYSLNEGIVKPVHVRQARKEVLGETEAPKRRLPVGVTTTVLLMIASAACAVGAVQWLHHPLNPQTAAMPVVAPSVIASSTAPAKKPVSVQTQQIAADTAETAQPVDAGEPATDEARVDTSPESAVNASANAGSGTSLFSGNVWEAIEQSGTKDLALRTMAEIWNPGESLRADEDICAQLAAKNHLCLQQRANEWLLRELNRPAMFHITGSDGVEHFAVIRSIDGKRAVIQLFQQQWEVDLTELVQRWGDSMMLIWVKPPGYVNDLQQGDSGESVEWLAKQLDRIQGQMIPPRVFHTMDALLVERLKDFQRSQGLPADGVAGPLTLMRINELIGIETPRLHFQENG